MARNLERQRKIAEAFRQLEELFCEELQDEPGETKSFDDLEMASIDVGDELTRRLLGRVTKARVVEQVEARCPTCSCKCQPIDQEPRVVQSLRGEVTWQEQNFYCNRCRRSFFPGEQPIVARGTQEP
jgi:hypothetical protein